jgi:hypothetical protein
VLESAFPPLPLSLFRIIFVRNICGGGSEDRASTRHQSCKVLGAYVSRRECFEHVGAISNPSLEGKGGSCKLQLCKAAFAALWRDHAARSTHARRSGFSHPSPVPQHGARHGGGREKSCRAYH